MQAIILAGGLGTRLRPLTTTCPKPLLPVGNLPLLARIIFSLRQQEIRTFTFLLHYQPELFKRTLGTGEAFDAHFEYAEIAKDLGTAGSVKYIGAQIRDTSLIYSADILAEVPVQRMLEFHRQKNALVTIALHPMPAPLAFGIVLRRGDGSIARFLEKPSWPQVFSDWINSAIYMITPELIEHIPNHGTFAMFEKEVFPPLAAARARIYGFPLNGYWRDVGTPEDLRLANIDFLHGELPFAMLTPAEAEHVRQAANAKPARPLYAGTDSIIAPSVRMHEAIIGNNCRIAEGVRISRSVVGDRVDIAGGAHIQGAIIMNDACVGAHAHVQDESLIGAGARIGAAAVLHAHALIHPGRQVGPGVVMRPQKILPTGFIRRFVDGGNLLGSPQECLPPEFLHWVGRAFASRQYQHSGELRPVLLATAHRGVLAESWRALAGGLAASAHAVQVLGEVTLPLTRKLLATGDYAGALYLGWEDFAGLLRVVLLQDNGENFSTLETCALERVELAEENGGASRQELNTMVAQEGYLRAMTSLLPKFVAPPRVLIGVIGQALEELMRQWCERLGISATLLTLPLEAQFSFKQKVKDFQRWLAHKYEEGFDAVFWMGSAGERLRLILPTQDVTNFGVSDSVLAQLLTKRGLKPWPMLGGWLMPEIKHHSSPPFAAEPIPILTGMNSSMAKLAQKCKYKKWYGFDGNGGITVSEWLHYHDAVMALAHALPVLAENDIYQLAQSVASLSTHHHLLTCPEEAKAQVIRRLIESFDDQECEVNDGVKIKRAWGWIVVRLCAGRPALEVFEYSWGKGARAEKEMEELLERMLRSLHEWILEIGGQKYKRQLRRA